MFPGRHFKTCLQLVCFQVLGRVFCTLFHRKVFISGPLHLFNIILMAEAICGKFSLLCWHERRHDRQRWGGLKSFFTWTFGASLDGSRWDSVRCTVGALHVIRMLAPFLKSGLCLCPLSKRLHASANLREWAMNARKSLQRSSFSTLKYSKMWSRRLGGFMADRTCWTATIFLSFKNPWKARSTLERAV